MTRAATPAARRRRSVSPDGAIALAAPVAVFGSLGAVAMLNLMVDPTTSPGGAGLAVLVLVVVIANATVLGGPAAGVFATLAATLSYDFVLVPPADTLELPTGGERWPLLTVVAAGVGVAAAGWTSRRRPASRSRQDPAPLDGDRIASQP